MGSGRVRSKSLAYAPTGARSAQEEALMKNEELFRRYADVKSAKEKSNITPDDVARTGANSPILVAYSRDIFENPDSESRFPTKPQSIKRVKEVSPQVWKKAIKELVGETKLTGEAFNNRVGISLMEYMGNRNPTSKPNVEIIAKTLLDNHAPLYTVQMALENTLNGDPATLYNSRLTKDITLQVISDSSSLNSFKNEVAFNTYQIITNFNNLLGIATQTYPRIKDKIVNGLDIGKNVAELGAEGLYSQALKSISISRHILETQERGGFGVPSAGGGGVDVLTHEFGHALHDTLMTELSLKNSQVSKAFSSHGDIFSIPGKTPLSLEAVSEYGNLNKREAFAEAFTMYTLKAEPSMGKEYYGKFKSLMKEVGLDKYEGINSPAKSSFVRKNEEGMSAKPQTVQATTLTKVTPQAPKKSAESLSFKIAGKAYTANISATAKNKGYLVKKVQGYAYTIDLATGKILHKNKVK